MTTIIHKAIMNRINEMKTNAELQHIQNQIMWKLEALEEAMNEQAMTTAMLKAFLLKKKL